MRYYRLRFCSSQRQHFRSRAPHTETPRCATMVCPPLSLVTPLCEVMAFRPTGLGTRRCIATAQRQLSSEIQRCITTERPQPNSATRPCSVMGKLAQDLAIPFLATNNSPNLPIPSRFHQSPKGATVTPAAIAGLSAAFYVGSVVRDMMRPTIETSLDVDIEEPADGLGMQKPGDRLTVDLAVMIISAV